jgi:hypothetical protein
MHLIGTEPGIVLGRGEQSSNRGRVHRPRWTPGLVPQRLHERRYIPPDVIIGFPRAVAALF